jgi:putative ABC transport system permease protein
MNWRYTFQESIQSLRYYQRRTIITMLSLGWGVASFLILVSYGSGFDDALRKSFTALGQDLVLIAPGQTSEQVGGLRAGRHIRIEKANVEALRETVPMIRYISGELFMGRQPVQYRNREKTYAIRAVEPDYQFIRNMAMNSGRWLSEGDNQSRARVAVIGGTIAKELFAGFPPEGQEINVKGTRFTIVGVLDTKAQLANYSTPDNLCVFIPYETMSVFRDTKYPNLVVYMPVSGLLRDESVRQVRAQLATVHRFSPQDMKAVEIIPFNQFMHIIDGMSLALRLLLGFVGTLTLGIGGVGLANIMLASVIERTREIGVLKALGGQRRSILSQFLVEALLIVGVGGLLGIALGVGVTALVSSMPLFGELFREQGAADKGSVRLTISTTAVLVSTGVLLVVGLIAGMIPAMKASRLDPIDALRYE